MVPRISCGPELVNGKKVSDPKDLQSNFMFEFTLYLCRKPEYYIFNIGFLNFVISSLAFAVFAISADDNGQRLEITVGILLTNVAFKTFLQDNLPKVPYSTTLDRYFNYTIVLVAAISAESALPALSQSRVVGNTTLNFSSPFLSACSG